MSKEQHHTMMPDFSIEKISPTKAEIYLKKNTANRPLTQRKIDAYAYDMSHEKWELTNDSICFNTAGELSNGQHRLHAIIKSRKTCEFGVMRNVSKEAFKYMDIAKTRTASDILSIEGVANAPKVAAIAKFVVNFKRSAYSDASSARRSNVGMTNADVSEFVDKNALAISESIFYGYRKENRGLIPASTLSGLFIIFSEKHSAMADDFCEKLVTGTNLEVDNPIYVLRQKLIFNARSIKKMTALHKLAIICKAWNHYRGNKKLTQFGWDSSKESFPRPI